MIAISVSSLGKAVGNFLTESYRYEEIRQKSISNIRESEQSYY